MSLRSKNRYCYRVKLSAYVRAYKMMYGSEEEDEDEDDDEDDEAQYMDPYNNYKSRYNGLLYKNVRVFTIIYYRIELFRQNIQSLLSWHPAKRACPKSNCWEKLIYSSKDVTIFFPACFFTFPTRFLSITH